MVVPRAMFFSYMCSGLVGVLITVGWSFCLTNLTAAEDDPTGFVAVYIMNKATGSAGATALVVIFASLMFISTLIFLASASRQLRGFTRDLGLPGSPWLKQLTTIQDTPIPLRCIMLSTLIALIFNLVNIASTSVFIALTSLTIGGLGLSFLIPIILITTKRVMKTQGEGFKWGRWTMSLFGYKVPGLGLAVNIVAIISLIVNTLFSFFPYYLPVTSDSLNWSAPAIAILVVIGIVYWFTVGRRVYRGVVQEHDCFDVPVAIFL